VQPERVNAVGDALRELDRLRQEGLISEAEFEQKRRLLLDQI
jgi:cytochrome c-type biogenesis protein CcmH/NrfG